MEASGSLVGKCVPASQPSQLSSLVSDDMLWFVELLNDPNLSNLPPVTAADGHVWRVPQTVLKLFLVISTGKRHIRYDESFQILAKFRRAIEGADAIDSISPAYWGIKNRDTRESPPQPPAGNSTASQPPRQLPLTGPPHLNLIVRDASGAISVVRWNKVPQRAAQWHVSGSTWREIPDHWKKSPENT